MEHALGAANQAIQLGKQLGFDFLKVQIREERRLGTRIAHSRICRENTLIETTHASIEGAMGGRHASLSVDFADVQQLLHLVESLQAKVLTSPVDKEWVTPNTPRVQSKWHANTDIFSLLYTPEVVFPCLEKHLAPLRSSQWQVAGYLEAKEQKTLHVDSRGFQAETHDTGMQIKFAVGREGEATSGCGHGSLVHGDHQSLDQLFGVALSEALEFAQLSRDPEEWSPGNYEVVLHHRALADLLPSIFWYGLLDRRKIDEGRTFLSGRWQEFEFPRTLAVDLKTQVDAPNGSLVVAPFSASGRRNDSLPIIRDGRIAHTFISPYWSLQTGLPATANWYDGHITTLESSNASAPTWRDLVAGVERGIFVNSFWYIRMVTEMEGVMTGMTRDGVYAIENGKISRPILNMRWHDQPLRLLQNIEAVSSEKRLSGLPTTAGGPGLSWLPAVRAKTFHFSSATKF